MQANESTCRQTAPTVLLVDDDPEMLMAIERVLRRDGYEVIALPSAARALEHVAKTRRHLDLVITDVRMPDGSGFQLLEEIKTTLPNLPVIIMTGYGDPAQRDFALQKGAIQYLYKPIPATVLLTAVQQALQKKGVKFKSTSRLLALSIQ